MTPPTKHNVAQFANQHVGTKAARKPATLTPPTKHNVARFANQHLGTKAARKPATLTPPTKHNVARFANQHLGTKAARKPATLAPPTKHNVADLAVPRQSAPGAQGGNHNYRRRLTGQRQILVPDCESPRIGIAGSAEPA